ncbi:S26 family signal peptidase [Oceanisphaera profunda]|uniref:Signal peptidase I n=1 Tax=Oceanisphaera profunda TaxID=1416627 RepID=A0A1Y0D6L6_9GAMM|nr:signal peptidase I [Oceanisphaera profunda]ART82944.1 S26 family signal peptidase [Oceanisphaera profunda]
MASNFALILVLVTLVTGIIWACDKWMWAPARARKIAAAQVAHGNKVDEAALARAAKIPGWIEQARSIFPVIAAVLILRSFIYEPFQIPSGSMMPTLLVGDFILVEKFAYGLKEPVGNTTLIATGQPKRGDVVVFKYPEDTRVDYIKRVVGLPGDRVVYQDKQLFIKPACEGTDCPDFAPVALTPGQAGEFSQMGTALERFSENLTERGHDILRNPIQPDRVSLYYGQPNTAQNEWLVPAGHYFTLGDNRDNSTDSRFWGFVPEENLVGKAVAIWISFEFERNADSWLPAWVPSNVRFSRIGAIH